MSFWVCLLKTLISQTELFLCSLSLVIWPTHTSLSLALNHKSCVVWLLNSISVYSFLLRLASFGPPPLVFVTSFFYLHSLPGLSVLVTDWSDHVTLVVKTFNGFPLSTYCLQDKSKFFWLVWKASQNLAPKYLLSVTSWKLPSHASLFKCRFQIFSPSHPSRSIVPSFVPSFVLYWHLTQIDSYFLF